MATATDIDIEEHDVLADSKVMGIFPDLSLVKTEVLDLDDEEPEDPNDQAPPNPEVIPDSTTGYDSPLPYQRTSESPHIVSSTQDDGTRLTPKIVGIQSKGNFFNNCILLGQKTKASLQDNVDRLELDYVPTEPNVNGTTEPSTEELGVVSNRIVLGQKPSSVPITALEFDDGCMDEEELFKCCSAVVQLDDWGPYLEGSDSYCKECEILFATVNALDAHKMVAHSFLVAVEPKEIVAKEKAAREPKKICFVCQKCFPTDDELIKHIYHHVSMKQECKECRQTFLSKKLLSEHMLSHSKSEPELSGSKCVKKTNDVAYKCKNCSRTYESLFVMNNHQRRIHGKIYPTASDYAIVDRLECGVCGKICFGIAAFDSHSLEHKEASTSQTLINLKPELSSVPESRAFVPKNTLFYCSDCDIHFTNLSVAFSHKKTCPKTEKVDCQTCPLTIASVCMESHQFQHSCVDNGSFDVLDVDAKALKARLLCICPKCEEYCSFESLWSHVSDCFIAPSYHCVSCNIYLHKTSEKDHRFAHDAYRLCKDDFFIIEYVEFVAKPEVKTPAAQNVITVGKKRKLVDVQTKSSKRPKEACEAIDCEFFYCRSCHFFLPKTGVVKVLSHIAGSCQSQKKRVCFTCGLVLTTNSIASHTRLHQRAGFAFENFKFFDVKTRIEIQPPLPEYPQCEKCKCYFLQAKTALKHICPAKDTVSCVKCNRKFSQVAYNLHKTFHVKRNISKNNKGIPPKRAERTKKLAFLGTKIESSSEMDVEEAPKHRKEPASKKVYETTSKAVAKLTKKPGSVVSDSSENEDAVDAVSESEPMTKGCSLYYCVSCKCCFGSSRFHKDQAGNCISPETLWKRKRTCAVCGVIVTQSFMKGHLESHGIDGETTLRDFQFKNFSEIPFLTPPLPSYYPCETCKVNHLTFLERRVHDCATDSIRCEYCGDSFSEAAYRLHVEFHKVGAKSSSRDFLAFQCTGCERLFSRSQVSSSQFRHSCSKPKHPSLYRHCGVCNFTVHKLFFTPHKKGHGKLKIVLFDPKMKRQGRKKTSIILRCAPCKLIFGVGIENNGTCPECGLELTKRLKSEIPNPVTKKLDTTKMRGKASEMPKLVAKKVSPPSERYLFYQCKHCKEAMKMKKNIEQHVLKRCGLRRKVFPPTVYCKICDLRFKSMRYHSHKELHKRFPKMRRDNIDVIKCAKSSTQSSIEFGKRKAIHIENNQTKTETKKAIATGKKYKVKSRVQKYKFYHCRSCLSAVRTLPHSCAPRKRLVKCPLCNLNISLNYYKMHGNFHSKNPDMVPENIILLPIGEKKRTVTRVTVNRKVAERFINRDKVKFKSKAKDSTASETSDDVGADFVDVTTDVQEETVESADHMSDVDNHDYIGETEGGQNAKYTFYRCNKCLGCVSSAQKAEEHKVFSDCAGWKKNHCEECGLDFVLRFITGHTLKHKQNADLTKDNIRIVNFGEATKSPEPSPRMKFVLYQCAECLICCEAQSGHVCDNVERRTCDICQYDFEPSYFVKHTECHKNDNYQRSAIKILPLEPTAEEDSELDVTPRRKRRHDVGLTRTIDVYKCTCGLHFLSQKSLIDHDFECKGAGKEPKGLQCSKCDLVFDPTQLVQHSIAHHGSLNLGIKYNVIESVGKVEQCAVCDTEFAKGERCPQCEPKSDLKDKENALCPKCRRVVPRSLLLHHLRSHKVQKQQQQRNHKNFVADKCEKCDAQYAKGGECEKCVTKEKESVERYQKFLAYYRAKVPCPKCSKQMSRSSLHRHLKLFRCKALRKKQNRVTNTVKRKNNCVTNGKAKTTVLKNTKKITKNIVNVVRKNTNSITTDSGKKTESKLMFNCGDCRVHFMSKIVFEAHKIKRRHVAPFVQCTVCKLNIFQEEIAAHLKVIHSDLYNRTGDLEEPETKIDKDTSKVAVSLKEKVKTVDIQAETNKANLSSKTTEEVFNDDGEAKAPDEKDQDEGSAGFEPMVKGMKRSHKGLTYYKCVECNVHFMTLKNIQQHLSRHKTLGEFDFIECKLCKLNIKVRSVPTHMEHHKNKNFSLDKLLFISYVRKSQIVKCNEETETNAVNVKVCYEINDAKVNVDEEKDSEVTSHVLDLTEATESTADNLGVDKVTDEVNGTTDNAKVPMRVLAMDKVAQDLLESTRNDLVTDIVTDEIEGEVSTEPGDTLNVSMDSGEDPMILGL